MLRWVITLHWKQWMWLITHVLKTHLIFVSIMIGIRCMIVVVAWHRIIVTVILWRECSNMNSLSIESCGNIAWSIVVLDNVAWHRGMLRACSIHGIVLRMSVPKLVSLYYKPSVVKRCFLRLLSTIYMDVKRYVYWFRTYLFEEGPVRFWAYGFRRE